SGLGMQKPGVGPGLRNHRAECAPPRSGPGSGPRSPQGPVRAAQAALQLLQLPALGFLSEDGSVSLPYRCGWLPTTTPAARMREFQADEFADRVRRFPPGRV